MEMFSLEILLFSGYEPVGVSPTLSLLGLGVKVGTESSCRRISGIG